MTQRGRKAEERTLQKESRGGGGGGMHGPGVGERRLGARTGRAGSGRREEERPHALMLEGGREGHPALRPDLLSTLPGTHLPASGPGELPGACPAPRPSPGQSGYRPAGRPSHNLGRASQTGAPWRSLCRPQLTSQAAPGPQAHSTG